MFATSVQLVTNFTGRSEDMPRSHRQSCVANLTVCSVRFFGSCLARSLADLLHRCPQIETSRDRHVEAHLPLALFLPVGSGA